MRLLARLAVVWMVAACHGRSARPVSETGVPLSAPTGGVIALVAVTDRGDAALTADSFSELRLWPTLDGTREPVVVRGPRAKQLALGRDRGGLLAAIVDEASDVELLRFDASGWLLGRVQLPSQPPVVQVVAIPGGVLVRRADHSIDRFDARGAPTGRVVPGPGQRVVSLAARRDRAIAGLAGPVDDRATTARWIELGTALAWGPAIALPEPLDDLAIAPGGHRLAGIGLAAVSLAELGYTAVGFSEIGSERAGKIVELEPRPRVVATLLLDRSGADDPPGPRPTLQPPPIIGFADDDTVVIGAPGQLTWYSARRPARWVAAGRTSEPAGDFVIADRAVAPHGGALEISDLGADHYLGYRWVGAGHASLPEPFRDGGGVLLSVQDGRLWLDPVLRARPLSRAGDWTTPELVLDDHHVLIAFTRPSHPLETHLAIRDLITGDDTEIAALADIDHLQYDAGSRVLGIATGDEILRYRLAFEPMGAAPLPSLSGAGRNSRFYLTDPALANGVVAVVRDYAGSPQALVYRLDGVRGSALTPTTLELTGSIAAVDRAAAIYVVARGLKVYPLAGQAAPRWLSGIIGITDATGITGISAISHDGTRLAAGDSDQVIVFDAGGAQRWRRRVWHARSVAWSPDDRTLFAVADGGATISFDAATGAQLAMRCGWGFGIYDEDIGVSANTPSACAAADPSTPVQPRPAP
jgi:hypothetical protein